MEVGEHGGELDAEPECGDDQQYGVVHRAGHRHHAAECGGESDQCGGYHEVGQRERYFAGWSERGGEPGDGLAVGGSNPAVHGDGEWRVGEHGGELDAEPECGDDQQYGVVHRASHHHHAAECGGESDQCGGYDEVGQRKRYFAGWGERGGDAGDGLAVGGSDPAVHGDGEWRVGEHGGELDAEPECGDDQQYGVVHRASHHHHAAECGGESDQCGGYHEVGQRERHPAGWGERGVSPATASLSAGQTQQFTATVSGGSGNTAVSWTLSPNVGTISSTGLYTAPATITTQQSVVVKATSVADTTKSASANVTLRAGVSVGVTPTTASLTSSQIQQFTATVSGGSGNTAVSWTLSPNVGTISSTGLYTAPATVTTQQSVVVKATSVADTSKSATTTITLSPGGPHGPDRPQR